MNRIDSISLWNLISRRGSPRINQFIYFSNSDLIPYAIRDEEYFKCKETFWIQNDRIHTVKIVFIMDDVIDKEERYQNYIQKKNTNDNMRKLPLIKWKIINQQVLQEILFISDNFFVRSEELSRTMPVCFSGSFVFPKIVTTTPPVFCASLIQGLISIQQKSIGGSGEGGVIKYILDLTPNGIYTDKYKVKNKIVNKVEGFNYCWVPIKRQSNTEMKSINDDELGSCLEFLLYAQSNMEDYGTILILTTEICGGVEGAISFSLWFLEKLKFISNLRLTDENTAEEELDKLEDKKNIAYHMMKHYTLNHNEDMEVKGSIPRPSVRAMNSVVERKLELSGHLTIT